MKTVAIVSGGMDSATLLAWLQKSHYGPFALSFDYGQRHKKELGYAEDLTLAMNIPHQVIDISGLKDFLGGSALTSDEIKVPDGHYTDASMKITVVPNRNLIMLSIAAGFAISIGADAVAYAAHAGDHAIYPDCRPEFAEAAEKAIRTGTGSSLRLVAPFMMLDKPTIVRIGHASDVDFSKTWSCYKGGDFHCGTCGTCVERREAFRIAHVKDPTIYRNGGLTVGVDAAVDKGP